MNQSPQMGNERPPLGNGPRRRSSHGSRPSSRRRAPSQPPQLHGRGYQTPAQRRRNAGGYQLQRHPINFAGRRGRLGALDPRLIVVVAVALVAVVLIVSSVVSCVSSAPAQDQGPAVSQDLPDDLQNSLKQALSRDSQLAEIAERGTEYPDTLIRLALAEPDAVGFVYGWTSSDHETARPYDDAVAKGEVPALFGWDARWGYLDYGGSPLAVTGSGPIACAMARIALLGNADQTPATIAQAAADAGKASGDSGTDASFFTEKGGDLGLAVTALDLAGTTSSGQGTEDRTQEQAGDQGSPAEDDGTADQTAAPDAAAMGDALAKALGDGTYVLAQTGGGALGAMPHWVLVTAGDGGAVAVHDPTSQANSSHQWDPATVASDVATALTVTARS